MLNANKPIEHRVEKELKIRGFRSRQGHKTCGEVQKIICAGESYRIRGRNNARAHLIVSYLDFFEFTVFDCFHLSSTIKEQFTLSIADTLSISSQLFMVLSETNSVGQSPIR